MSPLPSADGRPRKILAYSVLLLVVLFGFMVVTLNLDLAAADHAWLAVRAAAVHVIAAPSLALLVLWPRGGPYAPQDLRMGRISAVASASIGTAMLVEGVREGAPIALATGVVLLPLGIYLFARSWTLAQAPTAAGGSIVYGVVFALCVLSGALWSAMVFTDTSLSYTRHYTTTVKSDLRNLYGFQETHRASAGRFATLHEAWSEGWKPQKDVRVQMTSTETGWHAAAFHVHLDEECTIWGGTAPAGPVLGPVPGEPTCRKQ